MPRPAVGEAGPRAFTGWRGGLGIRLDSMGRTPREKAEGGGLRGCAQGVALGWEQRPTLGCVLLDGRRGTRDQNSFPFSSPGLGLQHQRQVRHRKNFPLRTGRELADLLPEAMRVSTEGDWLNSPGGWGARVPIGPSRPGLT